MADDMLMGLALLGAAFAVFETIRGIHRPATRHEENPTRIVFVDPKIFFKTGANSYIKEAINVGGDTETKTVLISETGAATVVHNPKAMTSTSF